MTTGERILALLPATARALREQLGIKSTSTLHKWLTRLRKAEQIQIGRWLRCTRDFIAVYALGQGKDAKRPKPWTPAELQARHRRTLKQNAERYLEYLIAARKRGYRYRQGRGQKLKIKPDPLMILLYRKI